MHVCIHVCTCVICKHAHVYTCVVCVLARGTCGCMCSFTCVCRMHSRVCACVVCMNAHVYVCCMCACTWCVCSYKHHALNKRAQPTQVRVLYVCMHACMKCACGHVGEFVEGMGTHVRVYVCMRARVHACMHICMCTYMLVLVFAFACVHL